MITRHLILIGMCSLCCAGPLAAQEASGDSRLVISPAPNGVSTLTVPAGQSRVLRFPTITRAAIGNPAVADIAVLSKTEVLLNSKSAGETLLYVQSARGAASITVKVPAQAIDEGALRSHLAQALEGTGITANIAGGVVVLRGEVNSAEDEQKAVAAAKALAPNVASLITVREKPVSTSVADALTAVLQPYNVSVRPAGGNTYVLEGATTPENYAMVSRLATQTGAGFQLVNMVSDSVPGRQIVIHARVVDVDQGALRELGFDWGSLTYDTNGAPIGVGQPVILGEAPYVDAQGKTWNQVRNLDQAGPLQRLQNLGTALSALERNSRAKVLSSPDILVQDGKKAEIVVGGEVPIPVPQVGGTGNLVVIEYREYGIKLVVTPKTGKDGSVSMNVQPEVSTLDYSNAVILNGFRIPAFLVRRANTDVTVQSGQTLVIGGLLLDQDVDSMRKVPILSDIPIFGELFKFRSRSRTHNQLVIMVTPEVLEAGEKPAIPPVASIEPDPVKLPDVVPSGDLKRKTDPPVMPGLPPAGKTPIPMVGRGAMSLVSPGLPLA